MNNKDNLYYQIIDTEPGLEDFTRTLQTEKAVAVDLEADSMYHFKEKVCLVQLATEKTNVIIDSLQVSDLSPLESFFLRHDIKKVFHGADYDVRSLNRDFNIEINNLFDTQIACRFLGIRETGLEAVIRNWFNVILDKKFQRKDWSKRPLPEDMMEYAAKDVIYLVPLANILEKELEKKGRLSWVYEECEYLSRVRYSLSDKDPLYLRFKGAGRLSRRELAVLETLLQFRKSIAEKRDKPPFKIIGNDSIMKIVKSRPASLRGLEKVKALSPKQIRLYGPDIVDAVKKGLQIPEKELPVYPRKKAPKISPPVPKRIKALKRWRDATAEVLEIDPYVLFNNSLINAIAVQNPHDANDLAMVKDMKNWQQTAFGADIVRVIKKAK
ncbi:MAG: ribonuclease D [Desulfobacterales bacterium]|nr:ribonuclease D [Desulfobacterales bacterium]